MYSIDIQIEYEGDTLPIPIERLTRAVQAVLDQHDISPDSALTIVIAADAHVQELNRQFRGVDAVTDVLSFPADDATTAGDDPDADGDDNTDPFAPPDWIDPDETDPPYLGDLIIAYPYTAHQAETLGHQLDDELTLLVIHGTLHLLGYDHDNATHQDAMWALQSEVLAALDVPIVVPRFSFDDPSSDTSSL